MNCTTPKFLSRLIRYACALALVAAAACAAAEGDGPLDHSDDGTPLTFGKADERAGPARAQLRLSRPADLIFTHSADCGSRCDLVLRYAPTQVDYARGASSRLEAQLSRWNGQRFEDVSEEGRELTPGTWRLGTELRVGDEGGVVFRELPPGRYRVTTEVAAASGSAVRSVALSVVAEQHPARSVLGCWYGRNCTGYCPGSPAFCGRDSDCVAGECLPRECNGAAAPSQNADLRAACDGATPLTLAAAPMPKPDTDVLEASLRPDLNATSPIACWSFVWRNATDVAREVLSVTFSSLGESAFDETAADFEVNLYPTWGDCRNGAAIPSTRIFGAQSHRNQQTYTHLAALEPASNSDRTMFVCAERRTGLTCDAAPERPGNLRVSVVRKDQNWDWFLGRHKLAPWDQGPPAAVHDDERAWF